MQRLVLKDRSATSVGGYVSFMGEAFDVRDPTALLLQAFLPPGTAVDPVLAATAEECDRLAQDGLEPGELARTVARMSTHVLRDADTVLTRALQYAVHEQQRADPALSLELPARLGRGHRGPGTRRGRHPGTGRRATIEVFLAARCARSERQRAAVASSDGGAA